MADLYVLCGLPASGKTTLALKLERYHKALRLSEDEWVTRLYGVDHAHDDDKRDLIKALQWDVADRVLRIGMDVIFDWGVWPKSERDAIRARAQVIGATVRLIYLDVSRDELIRRLQIRNADLPPNTFAVTVDELDEWTTYFEPPTVEELLF